MVELAAKSRKVLEEAINQINNLRESIIHETNSPKLFEYGRKVSDFKKEFLDDFDFPAHSQNVNLPDDKVERLKYFTLQTLQIIHANLVQLDNSVGHSRDPNELIGFVKLVQKISRALHL